MQVLKLFTKARPLQTPRCQIKCYCAPQHRRRECYFVERTCREEPVLGLPTSAAVHPRLATNATGLSTGGALPGGAGGLQAPLAHRTRPQEKQSRPHKGQYKTCVTAAVPAKPVAAKSCLYYSTPATHPPTQVPYVASRALHSPHTTSPGPGQFTGHTRPREKCNRLAFHARVCSCGRKPCSM